MWLMALDSQCLKSKGVSVVENFHIHFLLHKNLWKTFRTSRDDTHKQMLLPHTTTKISYQNVIAWCNTIPKLAAPLEDLFIRDASLYKRCIMDLLFLSSYNIVKLLSIVISMQVIMHNYWNLHVSPVTN